MTTPYSGFSYANLKNLSLVKTGDSIQCPICRQQHEVEPGTPPFLLFLQCGGQYYLAGIGGRLVIGAFIEISAV